MSKCVNCKWFKRVKNGEMPDGSQVFNSDGSTHGIGFCNNQNSFLQDVSVDESCGLWEKKEKSK